MNLAGKWEGEIEGTRILEREETAIKSPMDNLGAITGGEREQVNKIKQNKKKM